MIFLIILLGVLLLWFVLSYNHLIRLRTSIRNAWSQIDVQLKRRYDLIPNLVETAKGYLKHEREVLENVTKARNQAVAAHGVVEQAKAENFLTQTLRSLFAVVENYPELKADQQMLALSEELTSTENRIAFARQFYNDEVMRFNTKIQSIPTNVIARMFNFTSEEFFEIEERSQKEPVKVEF